LGKQGIDLSDQGTMRRGYWRHFSPLTRSGVF